MDVFPDRSFYIIKVNFGKVGVHLPKHQNVGEAANAQVMIVQIENVRESYTPASHANNSNCAVKTVYCRPTPTTRKSW